MEHGVTLASIHTLTHTQTHVLARIHTRTHARARAIQALWRYKPELVRTEMSPTYRGRDREVKREHISETPPPLCPLPPNLRSHLSSPTPKKIPAIRNKTHTSPVKKKLNKVSLVTELRCLRDEVMVIKIKRWRHLKPVPLRALKRPHRVCTSSWRAPRASRRLSPETPRTQPPRATRARLGTEGHRAGTPGETGQGDPPSRDSAPRPGPAAGLNERGRGLVTHTH